MVWLSEAALSVGRAVVYRKASNSRQEFGTITGVVGPYVMVRYGTDAHAKATYAEDLIWATAKLSPTSKGTAS